MDETNIDTAFEKFSSAVTNSLDQIRPEHEIKISPKKIIRDPWITPGMLLSSINMTRQHENIMDGTKCYYDRMGTIQN